MNIIIGFTVPVTETKVQIFSINTSFETEEDVRKSTKLDYVVLEVDYDTANNVVYMDTVNGEVELIPRVVETQAPTIEEQLQKIQSDQLIIMMAIAQMGGAIT